MYVCMYVCKAMHMQYNKMCQPSIVILLHYFLIPKIKYEIHRKFLSKT
jgi:hypothetical protein